MHLEAGCSQILICSAAFPASGPVRFSLGAEAAIATRALKMKIALVHKRLELRGGTERVLYRTASSSAATQQ
jgi:hypothetical protein